MEGSSAGPRLNPQPVVDEKHDFTIVQLHHGHGVLEAFDIHETRGAE
jgi:hypothetical protein